MPISLSKLCVDTDKTYKMKLIAGRDGLDNPVRWVHMIEDTEVADFIHGNELVFTTGIRQQGTEWLLGFVVGLLNKGAVGLVINLGPYISKIPPQVIIFCEKNAFPLFSIPWEIHIIDVTYDFCHRIIKNEEIETTIATTFKNVIFAKDDISEYESELQKHGYRKDSLYTILALNLSSKDTEDNINQLYKWKEYQFALNKIIKKASLSTCAFLQDRNLIIIRQNSTDIDIKLICKNIIELAKDNDTINIGISPTDGGYDKIQPLYRKALSALTIAKKHNVSSMNYNDLGVFRLIFSITDTNSLKDYIRSILGKLIDYDRDNHTDYVDTLKFYLENNCKVLTTATHFNVHRNTINYKIKSIKEILGISLTQKDITSILMAFYAMEVINNN